jgi:hypothetical protein
MKTRIRTVNVRVLATNHDSPNTNLQWKQAPHKLKVIHQHSERDVFNIMMSHASACVTFANFVCHSVPDMMLWQQ